MHKKEFDNFGNQSFFSTNHTNFDFDNEFDFDFESNSELFDSAFDRRNLNNQRNMAGEINVSTCQRLANILGGVVVTSTPACVVQRNRNINATILGRRTQSALSLPFALSFENNINGRTLNLGETVILQREINPFMSALRRRGLIVTAVHNHWLFDQPRLMYMHWENVGNPFEFAINSVEAAREVGLF